MGGGEPPVKRRALVEDQLIDEGGSQPVDLDSGQPVQPDALDHHLHLGLWVPEPHRSAADALAARQNREVDHQG